MSKRILDELIDLSQLYEKMDPSEEERKKMSNIHAIKALKGSNLLHGEQILDIFIDKLNEDLKTNSWEEPVENESDMDLD